MTRHWPDSPRRRPAGCVFSFGRQKEPDVAQLDKWLVRAAIFGATAAVIGAAIFWLLLTRPVAMAIALDQAF
jgi:hypothetical protein